MATVYMIFENWDEYPEEGGGLQGVVGVYDNLTSAQKMCDALNRAYNSDGYGYYIEEHKLNYCSEPIPQPKTYLDYWYKPYNEDYTVFNKEAHDLAHARASAGVELNEAY